MIATVGMDGSVVERYAYEPYGEQIDPTDGDTNPWRYVSGYTDTATGMIKFGTRYYMPDLGRWTQTDPEDGEFENPMTLNTYGYVVGDPVNFVDTAGRSLEAVMVIFGTIAFVAGTVAFLTAGPLIAVAAGAISFMFGAPVTLTAIACYFSDQC